MPYQSGSVIVSAILLEREPGHRPGLSLGGRTKRESGFTITELIVVIVVVGILAAVAVPRFFGRHGFEARGFADQVLASLHYARQAAIAQRRTVCVVFPGSDTLTLTRAATYGGSCDLSLATPAGDASYSLQAPTGVALGGAAFSFDELGRASAAATVTVNGGSEGSFTLTVEAESGYAHE